jgi:hypothetical protein
MFARSAQRLLLKIDKELPTSWLELDRDAVS